MVRAFSRAWAMQEAMLFGFLLTEALDDRFPEAAQALAVQTLEIEQELLVDVDEPRQVVGPFDIADHPVEGIGDA